MSLHPSIPRWITPFDAAEILRVPVRDVTKLVDQRLLRAQREEWPSQRVRVCTQDVALRLAGHQRWMEWSEACVLMEMGRYTLLRWVSAGRFRSIRFRATMPLMIDAAQVAEVAFHRRWTKIHSPKRVSEIPEQ